MLETKQGAAMQIINIIQNDKEKADALLKRLEYLDNYGRDIGMTIELWPDDGTDFGLLWRDQHGERWMNGGLIWHGEFYGVHT